MAERVVDVLEQVEIDAQHGHALLAGLGVLQRLLETFLIELSVSEIGHPVMVRHVGYARLGLAAFCDIDDRYEIAVAPVETHTPAEGENLDLAAVGLQVAPVAGRMIGVADLPQRLR